MKRLGGEVLQINTSGSSVAKGESLADTVRTVATYADAIVLRHAGVGSSRDAAAVSNVPIINAGDGIGEHPTQVRAFAHLSRRPPDRLVVATDSGKVVGGGRHCWTCTRFGRSSGRSMVW
jgi:hypothetical protein